MILLLKTAAAVREHQIEETVKGNRSAGHHSFDHNSSLGGILAIGRYTLILNTKRWKPCVSFTERLS